MSHVTAKMDHMIMDCCRIAMTTKDIETQELWCVHICVNVSVMLRSLALSLSPPSDQQANFWGENWVLSDWSCVPLRHVEW